MKPLSITLAFLLCASSQWVGAQSAAPSITPVVPSGKPLVQTHIESVSFLAETDEDKAYLIFSGSVKLTATNLELTCNQLEIFTDIKEEEEADPSENAIGDFSSIQKIIASGNVKIVQEERTATAGRAEVLPNEDVIMLDQNPMIFQKAYTMDGTGARLLIHRGNGRVEMIGNETNKVSFTGPPIQDLGFEENGQSITPAEDAPPQDSETKNDSPKTEDEEARKAP